MNFHYPFYDLLILRPKRFPGLALIEKLFPFSADTNCGYPEPNGQPRPAQRGRDLGQPQRASPGASILVRFDDHDGRVVAVIVDAGHCYRGQVTTTQVKIIAFENPCLKLTSGANLPYSHRERITGTVPGVS